MVQTGRNQIGPKEMGNAGMTVRIIQGDCLDVLKTLADASVDSCVTDPPYHLTTGKKGGTGPASVNLDTPQGRARVTTGFMGMTWDGGDVAHNPAMWAEVLRALKPGAYLLAFGGTRTYHRLACAIEDAGFEIRDQIGWAFGSGFPKSHNGPWGGTALKPAWEPIVMARKPLIGTVEANWKAHGTGALNIDGCRVETSETLTGSGTPPLQYGGTNHRPFHDTAIPRGMNQHDAGRWPANLIHDGSDEVLARFPEVPGQQRSVGPEHGAKDSVNVFGNYGARDTFNPRGDAGSAARFFYCAKASREDRNEGLQGMATKPLNWSSGEQSPGAFQSPNTNRQAQNHHPTVKPTDLMRYLCRLVTPKGGTVLDPFMGSGSTGRGAIREGFNFIGIEIDPEYCEISRLRINADAPLFAEVTA